MLSDFAALVGLDLVFWISTTSRRCCAYAIGEIRDV